MTTKIPLSARRKARFLALQTIYQWQLTQVAPSVTEDQLMQNQSLNKIDLPYFQELVRTIPKRVSELDKEMLVFLDRPLEELNPVELAILRLSIYEFIYRLDVPYRVVIDEALRLTKTFGGIESFKYVNAILDKVARILRKKEID